MSRIALITGQDSSYPTELFVEKRPRSPWYHPHQLQHESLAKLMVGVDAAS